MGVKRYLLIAFLGVFSLGLGLVFTQSFANPDSSSNQGDTSPITYIRKITQKDENSFQVSVIISKNDISGTAKVQETIPEGFDIAYNQLNNALTTTEQNSIKFLWENLPNKRTIELVYTLTKTSNIDEELTISGYFLYIENDIAIREISDPTSFTFNKGLITVIENTPPTIEKTSVPPLNLDSNKTKVQVKPEVVLAPETQIKTDFSAVSEATLEQTSNKSIVEGVSYKVQICALRKNPVKPEYFNKKHKIIGEVYVENHKGWIKYTTGNFIIYKDSRDFRNTLRDKHNLIGPFVTAYNNGERTTVQEALMLSKQKWYK